MVLMTHTNSFLSSREAEKYNRRQMILDCYGSAILTDREVRDRCGFQDMNSVRPRITELVEEGFLVEGPSVKDEVTGRTVRTTIKKVKTDLFE